MSTLITIKPKYMLKYICLGAFPPHILCMGRPPKMVNSDIAKYLRDSFLSQLACSLRFDCAPS